MSGPQNSLAKYILAGLTILLIVSNGAAGPLHPTNNATSVEATPRSLDPLPVAPRGNSGTHTTKRVKSSPTASHTQIVKTGTSNDSKGHSTASRTRTRATATPTNAADTQESSSTRGSSHSTASRTRTGTSPTSTNSASHKSSSTKGISHSTATRTRTGTTPTPTNSDSPSDSSCLLPAKSKTKSKQSKREPLSHPSAKDTITLFHGTYTEDDAESLERPLLALTDKKGDFNSGLKGRSPGGFYLTDSLLAAAQFVCYGGGGGADSDKDSNEDSNEDSNGDSDGGSNKTGSDDDRPDTAVIVEYTWTPGTSYADRIYEFADNKGDYNDFVDANLDYGSDKADPSKEEVARKIFQNMVMITGPMGLSVDDKKLTRDFWQYALIDQKAINDGLKKTTVYNNILCSQIPKGKDLSSELYAEGQRTNAKFEQRVHDLQTPGCAT